MRYGLTLPIEGLGLLEHQELVEALPGMGYTDVWSAEVDGLDGVTPLVLASQWAPTLQVGTAILPAYTRGPALMAQTAASLSAVAPGRAILGIGSSSDVIVERWNGIEFDEPYKRTRDMVRFVKMAMTGEKITQDFETFSVKGFRLKHGGVEPPTVLVAALRQGMLRMAGREADGAIINWLSAEDVATVIPHVHEQGDGKQIAARIFVLPVDDADFARSVGRRAIAAYLNVPVYRAFHEWLGRTPALQGMWDAWEAGDRAAAVEAIPDEVVDDLLVWGSPEVCRAKIQAYVDKGVTIPVLAPFIGPDGVIDVVRSLGPGGGD